LGVSLHRYLSSLREIVGIVFLVTGCDGVWRLLVAPDSAPR